ncbi:hypothetical protein Tco_0448865 [Tanacetum coccineum]
MQALLRAQLGVRSQRAHRSFKDHRVQPEIRHQKSTERFDNDTRSEIHSKRLSTSYDSIKNSYDERPKIAGMDPYRPHGQSRRNHYQDPERGFTGKDYKCSKTTRSTPRVAYSNRSVNRLDVAKDALDYVLVCTVKDFIASCFGKSIARSGVFHLRFPYEEAAAVVGAGTRSTELAYEQESMETRQALAKSEAHCRALEARVTVLETEALEAGARIDTLEDTGSSS